MSGFSGQSRSRKIWYAMGRSFLNAVKSRPCQDCGMTFPTSAMQFHHLYDKSFHIGQKAHWAGCGLIRRVIMEICKTVLLCANCHAVRTHGVGRP